MENKNVNNDCFTKCITKFEYKKQCDIAFSNFLGTCWYSSILSILMFSDTIGEDFQRGLFRMSDKEIDYRIEYLKYLVINFKINILNATDLDGMKELLRSIKRRLCIKKCPSIDTDIIKEKEEEQQCVLIHRNRHFIEEGTNIYNKIGTPSNYQVEITMFNTFTLAILNKIYKTQIINQNYPIYWNDKFIAVLVYIDKHVYSKYKCENKITTYNNHIQIKSDNGNQMINDTEHKTIKKLDIITDEIDIDITDNIYALQEDDDTLKVRLKKIVEAMSKKNENIEITDDELTYFLATDKTTGGKTLYQWAIIHNNIHMLNRIIHFRPEKINDIIDYTETIKKIQLLNMLKYKRYIIKNRNNYNSNIFNLLDAFYNNNTNRVKELLNEQEEIGSLFDYEIDGKSLSFMAIDTNNYDIIKLMVDKKINLVKEYNTDTILTYSIITKKKEIIQLLIDEYTRDLNNVLTEKINHINKLGETALMAASKKNNLDIVKYLIEKKADVNKQNNWGETALMYASKKNNLDIVKYLIEKKADVNKQNNWGETALMYASSENNTDTVYILLNNNADVNQQDKLGETALMYAVYYNNTDTVYILLNNNADVNITNKNNEKAINIIYDKQSQKGIYEMLEKRTQMSVNSGGKNKRTKKINHKTRPNKTYKKTKQSKKQKTKNTKRTNNRK